MADVLTKEQRRHCMSAIRGKNTKPEKRLRKALWHMGFRYRITNKLPGRPDIVFPSEHLAVFVDGCFWHGCPKHFQQPKTNETFWREKIQENRERDKKNNFALEKNGWLVLRFWEHEIRKDTDACAKKVIGELQRIRSRLT
ncbi:MAG: very short patch repair endonuclease [Chromatiales bacterium]|nr:very short patch repair endonuclease [Chromatiales bacterium]